MTLEELKIEADVQGVEYSSNIKYKALEKKIRDHISANEPQVEVVDEQTDQLDVMNLRAGAKVKDHEISATDEKYKMAGYDFEGLTDIRKARVLVRAIVMNMDPEKQSEKTLQIDIWNAVHGNIASRVIVFGKEWHMEKAILDDLNSQMYTYKEERAVDNKSNNISGYGTFIHTEQRKKYAIQILPKLTAGEIKKLALEQSKSDRLNDNN